MSETADPAAQGPLYGSQKPPRRLCSIPTTRCLPPTYLYISIRSRNGNPNSALDSPLPRPCLGPILAGPPAGTAPAGTWNLGEQPLTSWPAELSWPQRVSNWRGAPAVIPPSKLPALQQELARHTQVREVRAARSAARLSRWRPGGRGTPWNPPSSASHGGVSGVRAAGGG